MKLFDGNSAFVMLLHVLIPSKFSHSINIPVCFSSYNHQREIAKELC